MADTLPLSTGTFVLSGRQTYTGMQTLETTKVNGFDVIEAVRPNGRAGAIRGVTYTQTEVDKAAKIKLESDTPLVTTRSTYTLGDEDDKLIIASKSNSGNQPIATRSEFNTGAGSDELIMRGGSRNNSIDTGEGGDKVRIEGNVEDTTIKLGGGKDLLVFGGSVKNTTIDLGSDTFRDTVKFAEGTDLKGVVITGANEGDRLIIGSSEYSYNEESNSWIDSKDRKLDL